MLHNLVLLMLTESEFKFPGKIFNSTIERFMNKHTYVIFQLFIDEKYQFIFVSIYSKYYFKNDLKNEK